MKKYKLFTLIEVVVAIAILGLGLITAMNITVNVSRRMNKAMERWERQHVLAQALEYHLLCGFKESISPEVFPYRDYSVDFDLREVDDLPEGVEPIIGKWKLTRITATLKDINGEEVETIIMEKILRKDVM